MAVRVCALLLLLVVSAVLVRAQEEDEEDGSGTSEDSSGSRDKCDGGEEEPFDSDVRLAAFHFRELRTHLVIAGFILLVVLAKLGKCSSRANGQQLCCT